MIRLYEAEARAWRSMYGNPKVLRGGELEEALDCSPEEVKASRQLYEAGLQDRLDAGKDG